MPAALVDVIDRARRSRIALVNAMEGRLPRAFDAIAAIPAPPLMALCAAADRIRRAGIRALSPIARAVLVDRERRVAVLGTSLIALTFVAACALPMWMIALGPLVWGVPHVLSDVRYLLARRGYHRRPLVLLAVGLGVAAAALGFGVRGALVAALVALAVSRGSTARRAIGLALVAALFALAEWAGPLADMAFAHLHNVVAVALWWAWRPRETRLHWLPLLVFAACVALVLLGAAEPLLAATGGLRAKWTGLSFRYVASTLSPTTVGPLAARLVVLYAFAQAVHYIVWIRLIPEDDRRSHTPRSYQQSYRALRTDVGPWVLWIGAVGAVSFLAWALVVSAGAARSAYLSVSFFHGYLEIAAAAVFLSEGSADRAPLPVTE